MRERILSIAIYILFALLLMAFFYAQIIRYPYYSMLSKNNSIRVIPISGPRGNIYDRNGVALVSNKLCFDVALIYHEISDENKLMKTLEDVLGFSRQDMMNALNKAKLKPYAPVTIVEDIDKEKAFVLEEASVDVDGLKIETRSRRNYIYGNVGCHIFGYLSEVTEDELEELGDYGYHSKDLIGRSGLEKYYDYYLTGADGGTQIEVDNRGRQTRVIGLKEPSAGKDLQLTIDIALQSACDKLLGERRGAIVVMNPMTGEVLALSSHPTFDPNIFVKSGTSMDRLKLLRDKLGRPLSDKAISGFYPPGSVFKIVTSSAALETKSITEFTYFTCTGSYMLGNAKFDCWKEGGHGAQNVTDGLMNSCNVFFYNTGRKTGVDNLETYAKLYGFGKPTGIDLPDEVKGLVPGRAWKRSRGKSIWYEGETLNYAIGQGYLLVTPIQILNMMAAVANGGEIVRPYIVKRIDSTFVSSSKEGRLGVSEKTLNKVREGLYKVVNAEGGTGKRAKVEGLIVAGKTGTAQNPQGVTHAWFSGFAPFDGPKICLVVFVEHGGKGGLEGSEIAKGIFEVAKNRGYFNASTGSALTLSHVESFGTSTSSVSRDRRVKGI